MTSNNTTSNETQRDIQAVTYLESQKQHPLSVRDVAVKTYYRTRMQGSDEVTALRQAIACFQQ